MLWAARGVAIYLTEIDINDAGLHGDQAVRDEEVARRYEALIGTALAEPKVEAILTWQLTDNASWLASEPKLWRDKTRPPRPLPFDAQLQPKAAYHTIARLFATRLSFEDRHDEGPP